MSINLVLPVLSGVKLSSKDAIISILAYEKPLSAKKIHVKIRKTYGLTISYQATHKVLNELVEKKILQKKGKNYELDLKWVSYLRKFTEQLLSKEENKVSIHKAISKRIPNLYFNDLTSVDKFILSVGDLLEEEKKDELYFYWFHCWNPLFFSKEGYSNIKKIATQSSLYVLIRGDTVLDKWCGDRILMSKKNKFKCGVKDMNVPEFLIYKDYIFQVFYPKKIIDEVSKEFKKVKKFEDLDIDKLFNKVFEKKIGIPVIVSRNPKVAHKLKEKMKNYFKV